MRLPTETRIEDISVGGHQRAHIMLCILTLGMVPIEFLVAFGRLKMPMNGVVVSHVEKGFEVGMARNRCVEAVLSIEEKSRPKFLFFIGDDMLPPWDGLEKLLETMDPGKWDCLTGLYYLKGEPPTPLMWRDDHVGRLIPGRDFNVGEVVQVDFTGVDFTLIRTSLLAKFQKEYGPPYFKTGTTETKDLKNYKKLPGMVAHTEDFYFYNRAKALGARIGVHTGIRVAHLNIQSGHIY